MINPNISESVSKLIGAEARRSADPATEIVVRTAAVGVEFIETRFEALIAASAVAQIIAEEHDRVDAVVVAAFGDPGMPALKELVDIPVVGITEAVLHTAALQSSRFSIVAISRRMKPWYQDSVNLSGLGGRLASMRTLDVPIGEGIGAREARGSVGPGGVRRVAVGDVQLDHRESLLELARLCVSEDGADAVILAGAPLAGLARDLDGQIPVPVFDGISAGVKQAEVLVALGSGIHREGGLARPPRKPNIGLSVELAGALGQVP